MRGEPSAAEPIRGAADHTPTQTRIVVP
ncbi:MAG: hypothetical protein QOG69_251, partial [Actinomycetota bacterium]|nr:hypothetical protein [Actinomycetota bacterium]